MHKYFGITRIYVVIIAVLLIVLGYKVISHSGLLNDIQSNKSATTVDISKSLDISDKQGNKLTQDLGRYKVYPTMIYKVAYGDKESKRTLKIETEDNIIYYAITDINYNLENVYIKSIDDDNMLK